MIVYILYSKKLDKYYIGQTDLEVQVRLEQHINHFYGDNKYTSITNDWVIFLTIHCKSRMQAKKIEKHIKRMKSKIYIQNLLKYPEMVDKLLLRY